MTYCVGMRLNRGLVFMSDTRTSSGIDNISVYRKMFNFEVPGERHITMMSAGNLATSQSVISELEERFKVPEKRRMSLLDTPTIFQAATVVGKLLRDTIAAIPDRRQGTNRFNASIIMGGQIAGAEPRLFLIYPEGNFIEAGVDTPFFQIGETKYGRPIILRAYDPDMSFEDAAKLLMVSFDSTVKANLSVGLPLDLTVVERDNFTPLHLRRIERDDPYFRKISDGWGDALKKAFASLPPYRF